MIFVIGLGLALFFRVFLCSVVATVKPHQLTIAGKCVLATLLAGTVLGICLMVYAERERMLASEAAQEVRPAVLNFQ